MDNKNKMNAIIEEMRSMCAMMGEMHDKMTEMLDGMAGGENDSSKEDAKGMDNTGMKKGMLTSKMSKRSY